MSALYLIQTYCLPSLLHSCETWYLSSCDEKRVEVAWNNAFRKLFSAYWHESVPLSGNNLGKVVHTRVPLSPSSIVWYRSRGGDALRLGR